MLPALGSEFEDKVLCPLGVLGNIFLPLSTRGKGNVDGDMLQLGVNTETWNLFPKKCVMSLSFELILF